jgi:hypothetical protein
MTAAQIQDVLATAFISSYLDSSNPDYTVHFDVGTRAFYFDSDFDGVWDLIEIGHSTNLGSATTPEEAAQLLRQLLA